MASVPAHRLQQVIDRFDEANASLGDEYNEDPLAIIMAEVKILSTLRHPQVIQYI